MATLTFDSEFNGPLDLSTTAAWQPNYPWATLDGKNEDGPGLSSFYVNPNYAPLASASTLSASNGALDIQVKPTPSSVNPADVNNKPYVSGLLQTAASFSQLYGYFEMRAELPAGNGVGAAFWMVPEDGSWPPELDVMENLGQDPTTIYQTIHPAPSTVPQVQNAAAVPGGNDATSFHTYGVDWEADYTTFYVDGKETAKFATPASMNKPMYMILENDAQGNPASWGNPVDSTTPFPANFKVDYVRAYSSLPDLSGGGSPAPGGSAPPPVTTPSVDYITPGQGSFTDAAGNTYTLAADDTAMENGTAIPGGSGTGAMEYASATVYGQDAASKSWYTWDGSTWTSAAAPPAPTTSPPPVTTPPPVTPPPASPIVLTPTSGGSITDASGNVWTMTPQGAVDENGQGVPGGTGTSAFTIQNGLDYGQDAASKAWYTWDGSTWNAATTAPTLPSSPPPVVSTHTITLALAEDAYQGNAQFIASVDGKDLGPAQSVTTLESSGKSQAFTFSGNWGVGPHDISVAFTNDAYGGPGHDRNLYVNQISYDGVGALSSPVPLFSNGVATAHVGS